MTPEQHAALRKEFPASAIGKLPKGGVLLDYVGHAAVTDRLLACDPNWTWEPMAVGPNGEPLVVNGGLWIKLTVHDVTRPGWGDGKNTKEMISDAIRNAAMRFGVALDLWAKEDLHGDKPADGDPRDGDDGKFPPAYDLELKLTALAKEYAALDSTFSFEAEKKAVDRARQRPGYAEWLAREMAGLDAHVARLKETLAAASSPFKVPDGVESA